MQVTAGSGLQVLVAPGEAWVPGTSSATQSGYYCRVESSTALSISAASETNPRIDTIIAQVTDKAYAGGTETFSVSVVTGTAESGATLANKKGAGSVPASSIVLAYVLVPAKAVTIEAANIENVALPAVMGLNAWQLVETSVNVTAADSQLIKATANLTITSPTLGHAITFAVLANGHTVTVKAATGKIYGDAIEGANEIKLAKYQHIVLWSDGTNWFIVAGESEKTGIVEPNKGRVAGLEYEPSKTRLSLVVIYCLGPKNKAEIEGNVVAEAEEHGSLVLQCFPGQKWRAKSESGSGEIFRSTYYIQ